MANVRLSMIIQQEILRLKGLGHSKRKAAKILGINRGTVSKYWDQEGPLDAPAVVPPLWAQKVDWDYIKKELKRSTRTVLYEELKELYSELPSYQAFCSYLKNHYSEYLPEVTIKIERNPGDSIEVDYSGDSVYILNPQTGELYRVELFVSTLSYSGKIYAEFTYTQKLEDFIRSHCNMFTYYGGVSSYIIPDNCKTAVTKADYYDPVVNRTYHDMCKYYGLTVDPADKVSPKHKPNVERAIRFIQTDFFSRIRNKQFTSLTELNKELKEWLLMANNKEIQGRGQSRDYFFEKERKLLKNLPSEKYDLYYFKKAKVHPDCHIHHEKNYYSVPYQYVGKEVDVKFNQSMVHVYYNCQRISSHSSIKGTYHYSTKHEHYPENKLVEVNYHLNKAKKESRLLGENVELLINRLIGEARYPLKVLRKVQGILSLKNKFTKEELDYGCSEALEFNKLNYDNVRKFAKYYNKRPVSNMEAPKRQLSLICLQGGRNDGSTGTLK